MMQNGVLVGQDVLTHVRERLQEAGVGGPEGLIQLAGGHPD